ncbi:hypothetical protein SAMN05216480_11662 [Pustulibacterium marinum]|uniref:Sulfotransferase domain-containing protein n=1 Tax=Pustulibacterium marinum TaxID=1224947 RepID=A0A1I7IHT0_9FLAO|nr:hypothetical protein [Pustulibacterium marinum]SFU72465.1 hypothetical protein SAMN05216480_11662 [Pustulibacterium marinum]
MIDKIITKSKDIINPPIIQFGPIRSGSTLVYNILKDTYPNKKIIKKHTLNNFDIRRSKIIATYRNPLDCLTSSFKRYESFPNEDSIKKQIQELKKFGLDDLKNIFLRDDILKLKYEDFYGNYDYIFDSFEDFFGNSISKEKRNIIKSKYSIEAVIDKTKGFKNFSEFDKETNLHGNHISNTKGAPNIHADFFTNEHIKYIKHEFSDYLSTLGY